MLSSLRLPIAVPKLIKKPFVTQAKLPSQNHGKPNVVLSWVLVERVDGSAPDRGRNLRLHFNGIINRVDKKNSSLIKRLKHINRISPGSGDETRVFIVF